MTAKALKNNVTFGLVLGWVLTLTGLFNWYFRLEGPAWLAVGALGMVSLAVAVLAPGLHAHPQRWLRRIGEAIGGRLFQGLLVVLYFVIICPVGLIYRRLHGTDPFYSWSASPPDVAEGWLAKESSDQGRLVGRQSRRPTVLFEPLEILGYFAKNGQVLLLPCLILFLILGLVGIFVQSSALAPFIYTLF